MDNDLSPLADTEVYYLQSSAVGDDFKIFVGHCGDAPQSVLYVTDANGFFGAAVDIVRSMQLSKHLPPLLVVGIGYRRAALNDTLDLRTRDLTPTVMPQYAQYMSGSEMGGAPAFLSFIRTELMPWVTATLGVAAGDATYFGHSFGGLFGSHVLLHEPDAFQRYIIGSPSLWWNRPLMFDEEAAYAAAHDDLAAKVYMAIGAIETHEGRLREAVNMSPEEQAITGAMTIDMVAELARFADALAGRGYPSLSLRHDVFPDEFHITVGPLVLSRGLRYVYDAPT